MATITPQTPAEQVRYDVALELLDDVRRLDAQIKASHRRIRVAVKASGTSLTEIYGVGPIIAAQGFAGCHPDPAMYWDTLDATRSSPPV